MLIFRKYSTKNRIMKNTRRNFLKKISVAGILTPLITEKALAYPVITERKLRVALCGLGSYATNQLAPGIEKSKNCELVGIVTGTPEKAAKWKEKYKQCIHKMRNLRSTNFLWM